MENFQNDDKSINSGAQLKSCKMLMLWKYAMINFKQTVLIIIFTIISLIIIVVTIIVLTSGNPLPILPETSRAPPSTTENPNSRIRIYSREEWSALPPKPDIIDPHLKLPVEKIIIAHTANNINCNTTEKCLKYIRSLQKFMMINATNPLSDIPYNFLVGGDGNAYEGRGWFKKGAHTAGNNNGSIGIAFIGNFVELEPPQQQLRIAQLLLEEGVYLKHISPTYKLYGACQLTDSKSPGKALYNIISKWPHWSEKTP